MAEVNWKSKGFLLVTPQGYISEQAQKPILTQRHYTNAAGMVEVRDRRTSNPSVMKGRKVAFGGSHFAGECKELDLFFMTTDDYTSKLGEPDNTFGEGIKYFDRRFKITHLPQRGRIELL